jgi:hypothetical protein
MNITEQHIREFAYQIWESEGRPHGHTERHWEMASKLARAHAESEAPQQPQVNQAGSTEPAPSVEPIHPISPTQPLNLYRRAIRFSPLILFIPLALLSQLTQANRCRLLKRNKYPSYSPNQNDRAPNHRHHQL